MAAMAAGVPAAAAAPCASPPRSPAKNLRRKLSKLRRDSTVYDPSSEKVPTKVKFALGLGEQVAGVALPSLCWKDAKELNNTCLCLCRSCQAIYAFIAGFHLNVFLLEVACLPAGYVGTLQLVAGLWDTFNDPFIGSLSDKTRTRWGRRRPWILFASPPLGVAFFALWYRLPLETDNVYKLLYYLACYMVLSGCITSIQVQASGLAGPAYSY